jgi:hypothetical protein
MRWMTPLLAGLIAASSWTGRARADDDHCGPVSAVRCEALPSDPDALHDKLRSLDAEARTAIADRQPATAVRLFECLLIADPRSGHAANLAIALREAGDLAGALSAAICAERLTPPDSPGAARAHARREELEGLIAERARTGQNAVTSPVSPLVASEASTPSPAGAEQMGINLRPRRAPQPVASVASVVSGAQPPPPEHHRNLLRGATAVAAGAVLLAGGATIAYLTARTRAEQFNQEQDTKGFTAHAQSLQSSADHWQAVSIGGFAAAAAAGVTAYLIW